MFRCDRPRPAMVQPSMSVENQRFLLVDALGVCNDGCIAIIGAGGKTTTMSALAHEFRSLGKSVLITTTTKIWPPNDLVAVYGADRIATLRRAIRAHGIAVTGLAISVEGKILGLPPKSVCAYVQKTVADVVLCEADGAAGRSLKIHGIGEPVVPECSDRVLVMVGLDSVGQPATAATVHRIEALELSTGIALGTTIGPREVARILAATRCRLREDVPTVCVLNKADDAESILVGDQVANCLAIQRWPGRVVLTSRGHPLPCVDRMHRGFA